MLKAACHRTKLNAFADIEADILSGRSLLWMAWNGRTVESAAATILINSEIGKVCIITVCGGSDMKRWLPLIGQIEAYAQRRRLQSASASTAARAGCTCSMDMRKDTSSWTRI